MKNALLTLFFLSGFWVFGQTPPQGINYQAVAHDASGEPLSSQNITVRIGIISTSTTGTLEWEETHAVTTNDYGLFDLIIGDGTSTGSGSKSAFSAIEWSTDIHFLKVELDAGSGYESVGTMQFMSVPYAMHANTVSNDLVDDADADASNELITGATLSGTDLQITDAGGTTTVDLSSLSGSDNWGSQVVQSNATLSGDGTSGSPLMVVGDLTDDQDLSYDASSQALSIAGGNSVTLDVDDADANASNELITGATLSGTDLQITDAGGTTTVDLSSLAAADGDWQTTIGKVYNNTDLIGIGTSGTLSDYMLTVEQSSNGGGIANRVLSSVSTDVTGIRNQLSGNSTGNKYGIYTLITNGASGPQYGIWNDITGVTGSGNTLTGTYNRLTDGNGKKIGIQNLIGGGSGNNSKEGVYNKISTSGNSTGIGVNTDVSSSSGNSTLIGSRVNLTGGTGVKLGIDSRVTTTGNETTYTYYGQTIGAGSSSYGVYIIGETKNYFSGDLGLGTVNPSARLDVEGMTEVDTLRVEGAYTFPIFDGSSNQVLTTNGSGNLSWTTPTSGGDSDWTVAAGIVYNASHNVGIGTSSPSADLHVNGNVRIQDGSQGNGHILTSDAAGNTTWKANKVSFFSGMNSAGTTQAIAQGITTTLDFASGGSTLNSNEGGGYNSANNTFTAPVNGMYQFNVNMIFSGPVSDFFTIILNSDIGNLAERTGFLHGNSQTWLSETMSVTIHLSTGEKVWVTTRNNNAGMTFHQHRSSFSGHLIYAD